MCLIVFAWQVVPGAPLVAAATRGGPADGRFAAITNIRGPDERRADAPSRGALVADYLAGPLDAEAYIASIADSAGAYNGFNLVLGDRERLFWFSNRGGNDPRNGQQLAPGIYGISNSLLDAPWPKVVRTKAQFASLLCQGAPEDAYFEMLADTQRAPDLRLPDTGIEIDLERVLSAVCIETPGYGTRTSTVVKLYQQAPAELLERELQ